MADGGKLIDLIKDMGEDELINHFVMLAQELGLTVEDLETVKHVFVQDLRLKLGEMTTGGGEQ